MANSRGQKKNRFSPFAPSKNEAKLYQKFCNLTAQNKLLPKRALTLGATPELRDAAIRAGLESWGVDISPEMMKKLSLLMRYKNSPKNKQVIKNWLKINFAKNSFGIIMADASFINLASKRENEKIIKICKNILRVSGFLALRQIVYPEKFLYNTPAEILIKKFRKKKISWTDFFSDLRATAFKSKVYNKKTFQFDAKKNFGLIDELYKNNKLTKKEYKKINAFRNEIINTFYPEKEFIKLMQKNGFKLISKLQDGPNYYTKFLYFMAFKKV